MDLFGYLKEELAGRGWSITRLAESADVSVGLAAKWLAENPRRRVNPSPSSCVKIARALGVSPDYVLELAGHREPSERADSPSEWQSRVPLRIRQGSIAGSYERWMSVMAPRLGAEQADELFWKPLLAEAQQKREEAERSKALIEGAINAAQQAAVNPVVSDRIRPDNGTPAPLDPDLTDRKLPTVVATAA